MQIFSESVGVTSALNPFEYFAWSYFLVIHEPSTLLLEYFCREVSLVTSTNVQANEMMAVCQPAFFHAVISVVNRYGSFLPVSSLLKKEMPRLAFLLEKFACDIRGRKTNIPVLISIIVFLLSYCKYKIVTEQALPDVYSKGIHVDTRRITRFLKKNGFVAIQDYTTRIREIRSDKNKKNEPIYVRDLGPRICVATLPSVRGSSNTGILAVRKNYQSGADTANVGSTGGADASATGSISQTKQLPTSVTFGDFVRTLIENPKRVAHLDKLLIEAFDPYEHFVACYSKVCIGHGGGTDAIVNKVWVDYPDMKDVVIDPSDRLAYYFAKGVKRVGPKLYADRLFQGGKGAEKWQKLKDFLKNHSTVVQTSESIPSPNDPQQVQDAGAKKKQKLQKLPGSVVDLTEGHHENEVEQFQKRVRAKRKKSTDEEDKTQQKKPRASAKAAGKRKNDTEEQEEQESYFNNDGEEENICGSIVCNLFVENKHGVSFPEMDHFRGLCESFGENKTLVAKQWLALNAMATYHLTMGRSFAQQMGKLFTETGDTRNSKTPRYSEAFVGKAFESFGKPGLGEGKNKEIIVGELKEVCKDSDKKEEMKELIDQSSSFVSDFFQKNLPISGGFGGDEDLGSDFEV